MGRRAGRGRHRDERELERLLDASIDRLIAGMPAEQAVPSAALGCAAIVPLLQAGAVLVESGRVLETAGPRRGSGGLGWRSLAPVPRGTLPG